MGQNGKADILDVLPMEAEDSALLHVSPLSNNVKTEAPELDLTPGTIREELPRILKLAGPLAFENFTVFLQGVITVGFVGRLDPRSLSAMVLCASTFNITGLSLTMGIASGAETLSGQCYGAKNYRALGVTLQKSLLITWSTCVFIMLGWTQIHHLLSATGQPPGIADLALDLLWLWSPALVAIGTTECLKRYLMAQGDVLPTCIIYTLCTAIAPLINWVFIFGLGWGLHGSAIAYNTVSFMNCMGLFIYIQWKHKRLAGTGEETWSGWTTECLQKWGEYLTLAIPSTVMICLEWWTFEIVILMTGKLHEAEIDIGVMGLLFQIGGICYMVPLGLQGAASTRVSNALGQGRPNLARTAITAAFIVGTCSQSVIALTLFAGRSVWGYALSSDPVVVKRIAALLPFLALMVPCDGYNAIFSGIVRGCGRQVSAACINLLTFWGLGLPLSAVLGFSHDQRLGIRGFWIGLCTIVWVQCAAMRTLTWFFDWKLESLKAASRMERNSTDRIASDDKHSSELV